MSPKSINLPLPALRLCLPWEQRGRPDVKEVDRDGRSPHETAGDSRTDSIRQRLVLAGVQAIREVDVGVDVQRDQAAARECGEVLGDGWPDAIEVKTWRGLRTQGISQRKLSVLEWTHESLWGNGRFACVLWRDKLCRTTYYVLRRNKQLRRDNV